MRALQTIYFVRLDQETKQTLLEEKILCKYQHSKKTKK